MKNRILITLLVAAAATLAACGTPERPPPDPPQAEPAPVMVGGDRDAHGCIGSAGYSWCDRTARCERPWELARAQGFETSAENYAKFCAPPP